MRAVLWTLLLTVSLAGGPARAELVSHLPLDATLPPPADGDLADVGPGGNNGTFVGEDTPVFTEGFDGNPDGAILFDGMDDYVSLAQNDFLPLSNRPVFSIALWVKGGLQSDRRVFSEGSTSSNRPLFNIGTHNTGADGSVDFFLRNDANNTIVNHRKSQRPAFDDTWHHIAWVDVEGQVTLFVDGLPDPVDFSYTRTPLTTDTTTLGAILRGGPCCYFSGAIDDVRIYDHALGEEEVHALIELDCPDAGDTSCDGLVVEGPPGGGIGTWALTASGSDDGGDALRYIFRAENADDGSVIVAGPQESPVAELLLGVGTWSLSVTVDDDPFCFDESETATCSSELVIDPPPVLISHWSFDGTLEDPISGNHGVFAGGDPGEEPTFVEGFDGTPGGAIAFGGDDYVLATPASGLPIYLNESYTVAFWVKGLPGNDTRVFSESSDLDNSPLFNIGTRESSAGGGVNLFIRNDSGQGTAIGHRGSDRDAFDDTWHHVALVEDGPGNAIVYIDGVRDARDFSYERGPLTPNITTIGGILRGSPCCFFTGAVDEMRVYNFALSPEEVQSLVPEREDCPQEGDTHCTALDVAGPEGDVAGDWSLTATAQDDSADGDAGILYTFTAEGPEGEYLQSGPGTGATATFQLLPGLWTLTVRVDDDLFCHDVAEDSTCTLAVEVLSEPRRLVTELAFDGDLLDPVSGNDGAFVGEDAPVFVEGHDCADPGALSFDGVDDYAVLTPVEKLPISQTAAFSVAMWVKGIATPELRDRRVFSEANSSMDSRATLFNIGTHFQGANGAVDVFIREDPGGSTLVNHRLSEGTAFDGTWHHIAWTDEAGDAVLYIDGEPDPTDFSYTRGTLTVDTTTIGGILRNDACCFFPGDIDDVRIYNYALSAEEVAELFGTGPGSCCPEEGDTHCTALDIAGPAGNEPGTYTVTASAADDSGDAIIYTFEAREEGGTVLTAGPQAENSASFDLTEGNWTLSVSLDDDPDCDDAAADNACSREVSIVTPGVGPFVRGDVNVDGLRNITDAIVVLQFLFLGEAEPGCRAAADTSLQEDVNVTSAIYLLDWLFVGGDAPPAPATCAVSREPSDIELGCETPCEP